MNKNINNIIINYINYNRKYHKELLKKTKILKNVFNMLDQCHILDKDCFIKYDEKMKCWVIGNKRFM